MLQKADLNDQGILFSAITLLACILTATAICHLRGYDYREQQQQRLGCVDGLRGYLALLIFIHHFIITGFYYLNGQWKLPPSLFFINIGQSAVCLFFMITGFIFYRRIIQHEGKLDWYRFFKARLFRLVPLYWLVVATILAIVFFKGGATLREPLDVLLKHIAQWLSFMWYPDINQFPRTRTIVAGVIWTLKYEWLFYCSLPLIALVFRVSRRQRWLMSVFIAALLVIAYKNYRVNLLNLKAQFMTLFVIGGAIAWLYDFKQLRIYASHPLMALIGIGSMGYLYFNFFGSYGWQQYALISVFFLPIALGNSLFGLLKLNASIFLGEISYSLYLWHGVLLYLSFPLFFPGLTTGAPWQSWSWMIGLAAALVLVAWASYQLIEKPGIALGKRTLLPQPSTTPASR